VRSDRFVVHEWLSGGETIHEGGGSKITIGSSDFTSGDHISAGSFGMSFHQFVCCGRRKFALLRVFSKI
jgi:hypothetical protein